jgi:hypothetical protein
LPFVAVEDRGRGQERLQVAGEGHALDGQARPLPRLADEQGYTELLLEHLEVVADRGLRDSQLLRGEPETAAFPDNVEHFELPQGECETNHLACLPPLES